MTVPWGTERAVKRCTGTEGVGIEGSRDADLFRAIPEKYGVNMIDLFPRNDLQTM